MNNIKNEYWNDIVNNFLTSGLSQKEFARQNNLKVYTLGYWIRKLVESLFSYAFIFYYNLLF